MNLMPRQIVRQLFGNKRRSRTFHLPMFLSLLFPLAVQAQVTLQVTSNTNSVIQTGVAEVLGDLTLSKSGAGSQVTQASTLLILYPGVSISNVFSGAIPVSLSNSGILDTAGIAIRMTGGWVNTGITAQVTADTGTGGQIALTIPAGLSINNGDSIKINGVRANVTTNALNSDIAVFLDQNPANTFNLSSPTAVVASTKSGLSVAVTGVTIPVCGSTFNPSSTLTEGFMSAFVQQVPVSSVSPLSPRPLYGATANTQMHIVVTGLPSGVTINWPDSITANAGPGTLQVVNKTPSDVVYQFTTTNQSISDANVESFTIIPQVSFTGSADIGQSTIQAQLSPTGGTLDLPRFNDPLQPSQAPAFITTVSCNPAPTLTAMNPTSATAGSSPFTLTVTGGNFVAGAKVKWNLADKDTTFVSSTELRAIITQADLAAAGTAAVMVWNPPPGGGISLAQSFTINAINPVPTITGLNPNSVVYGGSAFVLSVSGTNFVSGSVARWNGSPRTTTVVSSTELRADIPASDIVSAGTALVTVFNPAPQGGESNPLSFSISYVRPAPTLASLSPNIKPAGSAAFQLVLTGTDFNSDSKVRWNGLDRATTYVGSTELRATILASDLPGVGSSTVTVFTPAPGGGLSNALAFTIDNPLPAITSLTPNTVATGSNALSLTVKGINFVDGSVVRWNGLSRTTTFVSSTQLSAVLPSGDFQVAAIASITVVNLPTGGGTSNAESFTVNNQTPVTTSITPASALLGANVTLTVNGSKFIADSKVRWNGQERSTTFVSSTKLQATLNAGDVSTGGTFPVTVVNPDPGGGTSNSQNFTVNNPAPTLSSLSPTSSTVGADALTITANGANLVAGSTVRWNGADLVTTFVNSSRVTAVVPVKSLSSVGAVTVTVFNPTPGGGASNGMTFQVTNPVPTLTKLSPASVAAGTSSLALSVQGSNFVAASKVRWNGSDMTTKYISPTELSVALAQSQLDQPATVPMTVFNPTPGGGASSSINFVVTVPPPALSGLNPTSALAGGAAFSLTINGSKFVSGSKVRWNGEERTTQFVSGTKLTASITSADILKAGAIPITVINPDQGGVSEAATFTVNNPVPTLSKSEPSTLRAGDPAFTMTVTGANFVDTSKVQWNGGERETSFVSPTQLKASISTDDLAKPGAIKITVFNPAPGGGTSAAFNFTIGNALPVITRISPSSAVAGGAGFTLTLDGKYFAKTSKVRWNGVERATTFINEIGRAHV
jgi:hypothetical protein